MVKKSELSFNDKIFPRRLIDVKATTDSQGSVFFVVPTDWDFHVISHTWTDAISQLATDCKAILSANGWTRDADPQGLTYNQTFTNTPFAGQSHYQSLVQFLLKLQADGVQRVWMDVLCINQLDSVEKASEMLQMGAYYNLTKGCYIATHGIGSSNGFKILDSDAKIPRWFNRVWTLQESILPNKMNFLVEKFDSKVVEYIQGDADTHIEDKAWVDWDTPLKHVSGEGDYSRRKVEELYWLGPKAYFDMMGTLLNARINGFGDLSEELLGDFYEAFGELAEGEQYIYLETLVKQIRVRNCSVEEDRVMGILGLIGFKGDETLTANQTLNIQLVALAKLLFKDKDLSHLIINLCAAEYEGYEYEGISWAPDLRADPDTSREEFRRYFINYVIVDKYSAVVKGVGDDGSLTMSAQYVKGSLIKLPQKGSDEVSYRLQAGKLTVDFKHDLDLEDNLPLHSHADNIKRGWESGLLIAAPNIHLFKDLPDEYSQGLPVCEVALVFLGYAQDPHLKASRRSSSTLVLMACIPLGGNKFHKIGTLHPHSTLAPLVKRLFVRPAADIVIGGVGADVSAYLDPKCQAVLKSLNA